jgi:hypothetical protein
MVSADTQSPGPSFSDNLLDASCCRVLKKFKNPARSDGMILKHWVQEPIHPSTSNGKAREIEDTNMQDGEGKAGAGEEEDVETGEPSPSLHAMTSR